MSELSAAFAWWVVLGIVVGRGWWERYGRPREIRIDPAVLSQINSLMVSAWLDSHDLMWMPKGIDFKVKHTKGETNDGSN